MSGKSLTGPSYLDFSKAFDTVPHQRLFLKLEKLGFEGRLLNWIKSFLKTVMFV
jgi:hypothetical protein